MNEHKVRHPRPKGLTAVLTIAVIIGLFTLGLSVQNAIALSHQADQREKDRIAADLAGCERGNLFRQQIIDLGEANETMITGILDLVFRTSQPSSPERAAAIAAIRSRLDQPIAEYDKTVAAIELIDCKAVTPGATTSP